MGSMLPEIAAGLAGLVLRELAAADTDAYHALLDRNREHIGRHGNYTAEASATRERVAEYFANPPRKNIRLGVWLAGQLIGRIDLNPVNPPHYVIGYWLSSDHTGHGYMTMACHAAIGYARDALGATDIFAGVTHGNDESVAVLTRLGFARVASFPDYDRYLLVLGQLPAGAGSAPTGSPDGPASDSGQVAGA